MIDSWQVEKFEKAAYNLRKARLLFNSGIDLGQVCTRLLGALNRCCEAWLLKNGHTPAPNGGRYTLKSLFSIKAPRQLLRKASLIGGKLTNLYYGDVYTERAFEGFEALPEDRREEVAACLVETAEFYEHVRFGHELRPFRWERENDFKQGQWVLLLNRATLYDNTNDPPRRWTTSRRLVWGLTERDAIVYDPVFRRLERMFVDTNFLFPTGENLDLSSERAQRRIWFDLHPDVRQIPLELPSYTGRGKTIEYASDFGASLYFTCPCCGYPVRSTHPSYCHFEEGGDLEFYEICLLCDWADANQCDDGDSLHEPVEENFGYSLAEARANFDAYGCIFQPKDGVYYSCHQDPQVIASKRTLRAFFDAMVDEPSQGGLFLFWWQVEPTRQDLLNAMKAFEKTHPEAYIAPSPRNIDTRSRWFDFKWENLEIIQPGIWIEDIIDGLSRIVAIWHGFNGRVAKIRNTKRHTRNISFGWAQPVEGKPSDFFWTPFYARLTWFEANKEWLKELLPCPCCGYPTLKSIGGFERCSICCWEDDWQDDHNADEVLAGPNGSYSLSSARRHFDETRCMFRPDDPEKETHVGCRDVHRPWKERLVSGYDRLIKIRTPAEAEAVWTEIDACWNEYRKLS